MTRLAKKKIEQRLEAVEQRQVAAERKAFASAAAHIVLAYFLGGLKAREVPPAGLARALNYEDVDDFYRDFAQTVRSRVLSHGKVTEMMRRTADAYDRLFTMFGYGRLVRTKDWDKECAPEMTQQKELTEKEEREQILALNIEREDAIIEIAELLPQRWKNFISKTLRVDDHCDKAADMIIQHFQSGEVKEKARQARREARS